MVLGPWVHLPDPNEDPPMSVHSPPAPALQRARTRRSGPVLAGLAVVLALWLGLDAPAVSPVSPPAAQVVPVEQVVQLPAPDVRFDRGERR